MPAPEDDESRLPKGGGEEKKRRRIWGRGGRSPAGGRRPFFPFDRIKPLKKAGDLLGIRRTKVTGELFDSKRGNGGEKLAFTTT